MSAQWPARKPTAHRAKCDQFIAHLDALVSELQETKLKLAETQSLLEAHSPGAVEDQDAVLFDCFVPRYPAEENCLDESDDFELNEKLLNDVSVSAVDPPFDGWRMGGSPGAVADRYIDWQLDNNEQISLIVGQFLSPEDANDCQARLTVDPLTHEYSLSGGEQFDFYLYDQQNCRLTIVEALHELPATQIERTDHPDNIQSASMLDGSWQGPGFAGGCRIRFTANRTADWRRRAFAGFETGIVVSSV